MKWLILLGVIGTCNFLYAPNSNRVPKSILKIESLSLWSRELWTDLIYIENLLPAVQNKKIGMTIISLKREAEKHIDAFRHIYIKCRYVSKAQKNVYYYQARQDLTRANQLIDYATFLISNRSPKARL